MTALNNSARQRMRFRQLAAVVLSITCGVASSFAQQPAANPGIDFAHDVVPILRKHCLECHGGQEAEGGFSINTRQSFLDDDMAVPGKPDESRFLELITSNDADVQMPPSENKRVPAAEIAVLRKWVVAKMPWESGFTFAAKTYEPPIQLVRTELPPALDGRTNPIDRIIDHHFKINDLNPPPEIDDATFVRRVYLDLIGLLPTTKELAEFHADQHPDKRARLVEKLLADDVRYAEHWLTFWNDLLRNDYTGTGFITGGRKQISKWLYRSLVDNKPYHQMTQELIAPPTAESRGFIDGIKWRGEVSAGQTLEIQFAQSVGQSFLGINIKCASCHDSFIDRWTLEDSYGLAAVYSTRELEIHRCDKPIGKIAKASWLYPELGRVNPKSPRDERLQQLATLVTSPANGRFSRTIVNRLWCQLMGRGIVHPVDAMQTRPWNEALLDTLALHLQEHNHDLKSVLKLIATSRAYQSRTEIVTSEDRDAAEYVFRGPLVKRMTAEQFIDNIWQLTDSAPAKHDAPLQRGKVTPAKATTAASSAKWIWSNSVNENTPPAGEAIAFRKTLTIENDVKSAGCIITCDNEYSMVLNSNVVSTGNDWTRLNAVHLTGKLKKGQNTIVVVGKNGGNSPNAAGLFFEARVQFTDGTKMSLPSDGTWEFCREFPAKTPVKKWPVGKLKWSPVAEVKTNPWSATIKPQLAQKFGEAMLSSSLMLRASLMKSDFLMRSLGRPNRDQIVTSRPNDLTTLEAIDLTNSQVLTSALQKGGTILSNKNWENTDALITNIFESTLSRSPSTGERQFLNEILGDKPQPETIADVIWSICMMPEFMLIR